MSAHDTATEAGAPAAVEPHSPWRSLVSALVANRLALFGLIVLALLILAALVGDRLAPYGPTQVIVSDRLHGPSLRHVFGTDELGRDVFSRVLVASRVSLQVGFIAVGISLTAGVLLGLIAGFYGRWIDDTIMRMTDMLFAFPAILLAQGNVFYFSGRVDEAWVGDERATPQPGRFYGGWVTSRVVGPFKGEPGSEGW